MDLICPDVLQLKALGLVDRVPRLAVINAAGADTPIVVINTKSTPTETLAGLSFPPRSVSMHPSPAASSATSPSGPPSTP